MMSRYDDWNDDDDSDDGYDAARDAYLTGEGPAVTRKQREEVEAWNEECRRNGWQSSEE